MARKIDLVMKDINKKYKAEYIGISRVKLSKILNDYKEIKRKIK